MSDLSKEKRIVFTRAEGGVSVVVPAPGFTIEQCLESPSVRADVETAVGPVSIVDVGDLPRDRLFRAAWKQDESGGCVECPDKSKEIAHEIRRSARAVKFAPHDEVIAKQIPGRADEAEAARQAIREADAIVQIEIDACKDVVELRAKVFEMVPVLRRVESEWTS